MVAAGACRGQTGQPGLRGWWLLQKPQLHWCPLAKCWGKGPCRWQSHSNPPVLHYPSGSSRVPPVPPSSHRSLHHPHHPTSSSILLLAPPSSYQSLHCPFILLLIPVGNKGGNCLSRMELVPLSQPGPWKVSLGSISRSAPPGQVGNLFPRSPWCCLHT